jgi:holo-[acyl-carrier protein] synthase
MAVRVGIDLVSVEAIEASIRTHADRYLEWVYTPRELEECEAADGLDAQRLAARFAAKEATIKVLRPGDEPVPWRDIEVQREPGGWTELQLGGHAAQLAERAGVAAFAVSLTHEDGYASAVVVAEMDHPRR